ncbi:hypothetical protein BG004_000440, partial [Podila humilis]
QQQPFPPQHAPEPFPSTASRSPPAQSSINGDRESLSSMYTTPDHFEYHRTSAQAQASPHVESTFHGLGREYGNHGGATYQQNQHLNSSSSSSSLQSLSTAPHGHGYYNTSNFQRHQDASFQQQQQQQQRASDQELLPHSLQYQQQSPIDCDYSEPRQFSLSQQQGRLNSHGHSPPLRSQESSSPRSPRLPSPRSRSPRTPPLTPLGHHSPGRKQLGRLARPRPIVTRKTTGDVHSASTASAPAGGCESSGNGGIGAAGRSVGGGGGGGGIGGGGGGVGPNRRLAHILSEQKRREKINGGFDELKNVVPE